jgi:hypothetical protein
VHLGKDKSEEYIRTSPKPAFFCISFGRYCNCKQVLYCPLVRPWNDIGVVTVSVFSVQTRMSSPKTWMLCLVPCFRTLNSICPVCRALLLDNEHSTVSEKNHSWSTVKTIYSLLVKLAHVLIANSIVKIYQIYHFHSIKCFQFILIFTHV